MSPILLPVLCPAGRCGLLVTGSSSASCPAPCSAITQCSECLQTPRCGWCAFGTLNGRGVCLEGGLAGPVSAVCGPDRVLLNETIPGKLTLDTYYLFEDVYIVRD